MATAKSDQKPDADPEQVATPDPDVAPTKEVVATKTGPDLGEGRTETYRALRPNGTTVTVHRNIDTGQHVVVDAETPKGATHGEQA